MTETERQQYRDAALRYRGMAHAQPQPDVILAMREQKIREDTIKQMLAILTKNARSEQRIGRRVLAMEYYFQDKENVKSKSQKIFAQELDISEGRASQLISAAEDALVKIKNGGEEIPKVPRPENQTAVNL